MKNKYGKIALIVLPVVFALGMLYPTFQAYQLQQELNAIPTDSLRSVWKEKHKEEWETAKKRRIKLGLDLRGGMYVTLEVDVVKLLEEDALSGVREDEIFKSVIAKTQSDAIGSNDDVLKIFLANFDAIAKPKGKTLLSYYDTGDLNNLSEATIIEKLKRDIEGAIEQARVVIEKRVDKFGVSEVSISKQGSRRIVVELPDVNDEKEVEKLLVTTARLEFKLLSNQQEMLKTFQKIDALLAGTTSPDDSTSVDSTSAKTDSTIAKSDSTAADSTKTDTAQKDPNNPYAGLSEEETRKRYLKDHPFTSLFDTQYAKDEKSKSQPVNFTIKQFPDGLYSFITLLDSRDKIIKLLKRPDVSQLMPADLEIAFSGKSESKRNPTIEMYGLKKEPELTGDVIVDAFPTFDQNGKNAVSMRMNDDGADKWASITGANIKKRIAVVLDSVVYTAPTVQNKITGGSSEISGMNDVAESSLISTILKAGALKAPVRIVEKQFVGASLGEDSIKQGLVASGVAFLLVVLFMAIYYSVGGVIANVAVLINVLLVLAALSPFGGYGGTLTLPGIAGIILTIAMAVDANVLIYERVREELAAGRSLYPSIKEGFKHAMRAIIDTHVTTLITGMILFFFGTGPIKGFALTLMIGILTTFFTGVFVSRAMIELMINEDTKTFNFGQAKA